MRHLPVLIVAVALLAPMASLAQDRDPDGDILVTFENSAARVLTTNAPYRARKRYTISAAAHRHADAVAKEYGLRQIAHWPIRSLSVYCVVYRVAAGSDRDRIIEALQNGASIRNTLAFKKKCTPTEKLHFLRKVF